MKRSTALVLLSLALLLVPSLSSPAEEVPYPATPEELVQRFAGLLARQWVRADLCEEVLRSLVSTRSRPIVWQAERILAGAMAFPAFRTQSLATEEAQATVAVAPVPGPTNFVVVREESQWRVDLLATLENLPDPWRPDKEEMAEITAEAEQEASLGNLSQLAWGLLMYAKDHGHYLPPADRWMDLVKPYVENSEDVFKSPAAPEQEYAYAFNARLSGANLGRLAEACQTALVFESRRDWRNAAGGPEALPKEPWHEHGWGVAFVTGRAVFAKKVPNFQPKYREPRPPAPPGKAAEPGMLPGPGMPPAPPPPFPPDGPPYPYDPDAPPPGP